MTFAGDGEYLMNGQELATAVQYKAGVLIIVFNNQMFGTIRMHQEREYPGRVSGTTLHNPDFAAVARALAAMAKPSQPPRNSARPCNARWPSPASNRCRPLLSCVTTAT